MIRLNELQVPKLAASDHSPPLSPMLATSVQRAVRQVLHIPRDHLADESVLKLFRFPSHPHRPTTPDAISR